MIKRILISNTYITNYNTYVTINKMTKTISPLLAEDSYYTPVKVLSLLRYWVFTLLRYGVLTFTGISNY